MHAQHPRGHRLKRGDQGGLEGRAAGHSGDGHGDCELWINCHRVFDLWCLCRFVALYHLALSFFFFSSWRDLFPLPLPFQGDSSLFGRHPFLLFFLRFAFVWLIVLDRARFQRAASPSLSFSFFYNNDFTLTDYFFLLRSLFYLSFSSSDDSANNDINVHRFIANIPRLPFVSPVCRSSRSGKLTIRFDTADVGIIQMSATVRFRYKNFSIYRSTAVAIDCERRCNTRMLYN